jgi:hypothetical protein
MPAVLNEAFRSPFDKLATQDTTTADIRNPDVQNLDFHQVQYAPTQQGYEQGYGYAPVHQQPQPSYQQQPHQQQPHQQHQQQPHQSHQQHQPIYWGGSPYYQLPQPHQPQPQPQPQQHNCDRLIGEIMACRVCRNKLQRLLNAWEDDHPKEVASRQHHQHQHQHQHGGSGWEDWSPNFISNIIIGIAIIFMLDRILKLKLT